MEFLEKLIALGKTIKVLYVEDEDALRNETTKMLKRIFAQVIVAKEGQEGERLFLQETPDMVITDIEMPLVNGLELSRRIKKHNPECLILVVSAYGNAEWFLEAIESEIDYYVIKPVDSPKLFSILFTMSSRIQDLRAAHAYRAEQLKTQIEQEKNLMLSQISNSSPNPMVLYIDGVHYFHNEMFATTFLENGDMAQVGQESALVDFINERIYKDDLIEASGDFADHFHINHFDMKDEKFALSTKLGKKIFLLIKRPFDGGSRKKGILYTFNDITKLFYQEKQLDLYNKQLEGLVDTNFTTKNVVNDGIINKISFD